MRRQSLCRATVRVSRLRQVAAPPRREQPGAATLLRIPDGFEGTPLGFWCPVCGAEVPEPDQFLALVEAPCSGRDAVRWLMPVHRACCAWPASA
jgi:hypothetical protein